MMSHKKVGPDRFSRFDVYWIQTNKQTPKQTDKPNLYIDNPDRYENVYLLTRMQFCIHPNSNRNNLTHNQFGIIFFDESTIVKR